MSDLAGGNEFKVPYPMEPELQEWMMANNGAYAEQRGRGLDVLHRLREGLPLSPREIAIAQRVQENPAWEEYREFGMDQAAMDRIMVDNIGSFLANPEGQTADLAEIAKLSDVRPEAQS